jgi:hypothetical protein
MTVRGGLWRTTNVTRSPVDMEGVVLYESGKRTTPELVVLLGFNVPCIMIPPSEKLRH